MRKKLTLLMVVSCFALWGLLNNMTDNLVPAFAKIFMIDAVDSSLVQVAFYGAYAVLALPAAFIIKRWGFRAGLLVGLGFYIIGALGYIPAAALSCYELFLVSIFVLSCGLSVLETTCNPLVLSLGSEETAIQRLNLAQAVNPVGSIAGLFLAKYVILAHLGSQTVEERALMPADELSALQAEELFWVCAPYVGLIFLCAVIWIYFLRTKNIGEAVKDEGKEVFEMENPDRPPLEASATNGMRGGLKRFRYWGGVVAQFFYIGVQISVWTWSTKYVMTTLGISREDEAATYYLIAMFLFIGCRWLCTALLRMGVRADRLLLAFALGGILCSLGAVYLPATDVFCAFSLHFTQNTLALIGISGFMSLMFPTIYGLALRGLQPDEQKFGAAGLIMSIIGGAIITPLMGACIDGGTFSALASGTYEAVEQAVRTSFYLPVLCFAVVAVYAKAVR